MNIKYSYVSLCIALLLPLPGMGMVSQQRQSIFNTRNACIGIATVASLFALGLWRWHSSNKPKAPDNTSVSSLSSSIQSMTTSEAVHIPATITTTPTSSLEPSTTSQITTSSTTYTTTAHAIATATTTTTSTSIQPATYTMAKYDHTLHWSLVKELFERHGYLEDVLERIRVCFHQKRIADPGADLHNGHLHIRIIQNDRGIIIGCISYHLQGYRGEFLGKIENFIIADDKYLKSYGKYLLDYVTHYLHHRGAQDISIHIKHFTLNYEKFFCEQGFRPAMKTILNTPLGSVITSVFLKKPWYKKPICFVDHLAIVPAPGYDCLD